MNFQDETQSLRNEVAKLRQERDDLGEKLGAAYHRIGKLEGALSWIIDGSELIDDPRMGGATQCYALGFADFDTAERALRLQLSEKRNNQNKQ